MSIVVYGIPNCDTVRKARAWLAEAGVAYDFHDYKKAGADPARLRRWAGVAGWERLLNRAGTTFRKLPEAERADLDEARALALMAAHPSAIRRPVVEHAGGLLVGFDPAAWSVMTAGG
jgi:Spx/MgsR family transcriptional regulator